ncbi:hypothetical protein LTR08_003206 [Meristemomyces frigidus]|nr:hypothetical protein LTR08_003206 [Meristemomyces frigidus]
MAPINGATKRKPRRKARTEVSSASSSSDNDSQASRQSSPFIAHTSNSTVAAPLSPVSDSEADEVEQPAFTNNKSPAVDAEQAFADFYLRQATREFADELDKLRAAGDFNARSVGVLVGGLKQGCACFTREERGRVGAVAAGRREGNGA